MVTGILTLVRYIEKYKMKISWRGHASFLIEVEGKRIVTDPFPERIGLPLKPLAADFVTLSHEHWDHNAFDTVAGKPQIIRGTLDAGTIKFRGIPVFHDKHQGQERGSNTVIKISAAGLNVVHLGDLGHVLTPEQVEKIGRVDILLIPVGGRYSIDAGEAVQVVDQLQSRIVIPMHFSMPGVSVNLAALENFTGRYDQVIKKPFLEIDNSQPGDDLRIIVLDYLVL